MFLVSQTQSQNLISLVLYNIIQCEPLIILIYFTILTLLKIPTETLLHFVSLQKDYKRVKTSIEIFTTDLCCSKSCYTKSLNTKT